MIIREERKLIEANVLTIRCNVCGNIFESIYHEDYCSQDCLSKRHLTRHLGATRRQTLKRKKLRDEARALRPDVMCAHCQKPFRPIRTDAKYCSDACRQVAYRNRNKSNSKQEVTYGKEGLQTECRIYFSGHSLRLHSLDNTELPSIEKTCFPGVQLEVSLQTFKDTLPRTLW